MVRGRLLLLSAGLIALTVAAYAPLWRNDFIDLDDTLYITKNQEVKGGLTGHDVAWAWTTFHGGFYIPLTWMSLQLDGSLFPLHDPVRGRLPNPKVFHAQNLCWHAANVLLLFAVLRLMTGAVWRSVLVAALFAVHPMHVESVAWATERKDVLSTFFWLLAMLAYVLYARTGKAAWYGATLLALLLGLLSKPMLVTLPCVLLLFDVWPLQRLRWPGVKQALPSTEAAGASGSPLTRCSPGWLLLEKLPLFALAAGASVLTIVGQAHLQGVVSLETLPISARLGNAVASYGWYLEKTFWPTGLTPFYPHPFSNWTWGPVLEGGFLLLLGTLAVVLLARRMPWLVVGWLWFLGTLAPVIGLVQSGLQARGDRFIYVPHIGLFIALVWTAADVLARLRVPAMARAGLAGVCLAVLTALTTVQVTRWRDSETAWRYNLTVTSRNAYAHFMLAQRLGAQAFNETSPERAREKLQESRDHFETAAAIRPKGEYLAHLGVICLFQNDLSPASEALQGALALNPARADWWHDLGLIHLRQRRPALAADEFAHSLALQRERATDKPEPADDRGMANTLANLGMAQWRNGQRDKAKASWEEALRLSPTEAVALNGKGLLLLRLGQVQSAAECFKAALRTAPNVAMQHSNLGVALGRLDEWSSVQSHRDAIRLETDRLKMVTPDYTDLALYRRRLAFTLSAFAQDPDAATEYREALRLDPTWPRRCVGQAWKLAADPDPAQRDPATAYELASQACQATTDPPAEALDALAAALAATGRFADAAKTARKALLKAAPDLAKQIQRRLKLYERSKPYVRGS